MLFLWLLLLSGFVTFFYFGDHYHYYHSYHFCDKDSITTNKNIDIAIPLVIIPIYHHHHRHNNHHYHHHHL